MLRIATILLAATAVFAEATGPSVLATSEVAFTIEAPTASSVCVVGDFNGWDASRTPLAKDATGTWRVRTDLRRGKVYDYAFVVDGHWILDPRNPLRSADGKLSVIEVPGGPEDGVTGAGLEPVRAMLKRMAEKLSCYGEEVAAIRREVAASNDALAKKDAQIDLLRREVDDARTEKLTLTKELTEARIRLDEVSQRYETLKADRDNHSDEGEKAAKRAKDLERQFADLQGKMNSLLQEKRQAEERAGKAESDAKEAQARFHALDQKYMEMSKGDGEAEKDEEPLPAPGPEKTAPPKDPAAGTDPGAADSKEPPLDAPTAKAPEGRVLVVGSQATRMVMISLGRKQGVKVGDEFFVRRGVQVIAKVKVDRVQDEYSAAQVQGEVKMTEIAEDDPVEVGR